MGNPDLIWGVRYLRRITARTQYDVPLAAAGARGRRNTRISGTVGPHAAGVIFGTDFSMPGPLCSLTQAQAVIACLHSNVLQVQQLLRELTGPACLLLGSRGSSSPRAASPPRAMREASHASLQASALLPSRLPYLRRWAGGAPLPWPAS